MRSRSLMLCYHALSDEWGHELAVTPGAFERQLKGLLRRGFRPAGADEVVEGYGRFLHVTFDDAYASIGRALPVLERLGIRATVFVATSYADDGRPLAVPELEAEAAAQPGHLATMDWDDLRGLAERGIEIGSHTDSHPHLRSLGDADLDRELRDSRARCEDELGLQCRYLAYPYGEHDARVQVAAVRAGYGAAFALRQDADTSNRFALPRVDLYRGDSLLRATLKTSFVGKPVSRLRSLVRGRAD
ncbi:MAG: polysaccharide deacetylase family protein [Gaiellaceae bacterium]